MIWCFFEEYKTTVLNVSSKRSIKELKLYEKIILIILVIGTICSTVFSMIKNVYAEIITVSLMFVCIVLKMMIDNFPENKRQIIEQRKKNNIKRLKLLGGLLKKYEISPYDEDRIRGIISLINEEIGRRKVWNVYSNIMGKYSLYFLIPVISIFLAKYLDTKSISELVIRAGKIIGVSFFIVLSLAAFTDSLTDLLERERRNMRCLVNDLESIVTFNNYYQLVCLEHLDNN